MINKLDNPLHRCELKFDVKEEGSFEGYASVFNGDDAVNDTIEPGAFKDTIKAHKKKGTMPKMFINHDSWMIPVADIKEMVEDEVGLFIKGMVDMVHKDGPTLYSALKRKAIDAFSIGFRIPKGGSELKDEENPFSGRIISKIDLHEVSFVNFPADDAARISVVKGDLDLITNLKEAEKYLRDSGYSNKAATALVSRIKQIAQSDSEKFESEITRQHAEQNTARLVHFIDNLKVNCNVK
jgi:HK97 family phage prohead protease